MRVATAAPTRFVTFYNWSDRPFTWMWGGVPYTTQPGEKMKMEEGIARIFAIHLGEREAAKMGIVPVRVTDPFISLANRALPDGGTVATEKENTSAAQTKEELLHRLSSGGEDFVTANPIGGSAVDHEIDDVKMDVKPEDYSDATLAKELLAENSKNLVAKQFCGSCNSKGVTHKKECPTRLSKVAVENSAFAGLKTNAPAS